MKTILSWCFMHSSGSLSQCRNQGDEAVGNTSFLSGISAYWKFQALNVLSYEHTQVFGRCSMISLLMLSVGAWKVVNNFTTFLCASSLIIINQLVNKKRLSRAQYWVIFVKDSWMILFSNLSSTVYVLGF